MKKSLKRLLSLVMVLTMVIGSAPLSGFVDLELPDWLDFSKIFQTEAEAEDLTHIHTHGEEVKENVVPATATKEGSYDAVEYCIVCGEEVSRATIIVPNYGGNDDFSAQEGCRFKLGLYPQSLVVNDEIITALNTISTTNGELQYQDDKYRKFTGNYYLYEPIIWKVISIDNNGIYAVSENILDARPFKSTGFWQSACTWETCTLRQWLNDTFYNTAFLAKEKTLIKTTKISTPPHPKETSIITNDTIDNVFVPSLFEAENFGDNSSRIAKLTDYSLKVSMNCKTEPLNGMYNENSTNGVYWLRTMGISRGACTVYQGGGLDPNYNRDFFGNHDDRVGVRPAIYLDFNDFDSVEKVLDTEIEFGEDRFTFGEEMTGYVGDTLNGLLVYISAKNNISSLTIKSSNTSVVEVGTIKLDSGDYICGENEHRATVQLNLKSKGNATITITSPEGVSESVTVTVSSKTPDLTEEEKQYINEHVNFVKSNNYNNLVTNASFYNQIWKHEEGSKSFTAYAVWSVVGDVGKVLTFNLPGLLKTENPYDLILVDIFKDMAEKEGIPDLFQKIVKGFFASPGMYNDFLDMFKTSEAWSDDFAEPLADYIKNTQVKWVNGTFITSSSFDLDDYNPALYSGLQTVIKGLDNSKLTKFFGGLKSTGTIIDYIGTSGDVVYRLFDAYQRYVIAQAIFEANAEILSALQIIANSYMPKGAGDLLDDAIEPYWAAYNCDSAFAAVNKILMETGFADAAGTALYTYLAKDIVWEMANFAMQEVWGFSLGGLAATYNLTYLCLDYVTGLGEQSQTHELMNAAALLEKEVVIFVKSHARSLSSNQTIEYAKAFDSIWGFLQSLEGYCYKTMSTYISAFKKSHKFDYAIDTAVVNSYFYKIIRKAQLEEDLAACDAAIQTVVYLENEWYKYKCHNGNYTKSKLGSVKCPTDVYIYDSGGNLVLSIVDNKITYRAENITAFVDGDEKIFALPTDQEYDIKITATDNGKMDYAIKTFDTLELKRVVVYEDISLVINQNHYGDIPADADVPASDYDLTSDDGKKESADVDEYIKDSTISVENMPTKTEYRVGEVLDTTGLKLKVVYEDGTIETVTSGFECSLTKFNSEGTKTVNVVYGGAVCSFDVTVKSATTTITSLEIATKPDKTVYSAGEALDTMGLTVKATYSNGKVYTLSDDVLICTPTVLDEIGEQTITVTYKNVSCTFNVTVTLTTISGIEVVTLPAKLKYHAGDKIDTTGLTAKVTYSNGKVYTLSDDVLTCTPEILSETGKQEITVKYKTANCTFDVDVFEHFFGEWETTKKPTDFEDGKKERTCSVCGEKEEDIVLKTGVIVTLTNSDGQVVMTGVIEGNSEKYKFVGLEDGKYMATFSKVNCVTRSYEIIISGGDTECCFDLNLIGDINGDGKVNAVDVARANAHAKGVNVLSGYDLDCVDVNGDGRVNAVDVALVNAHSKGVKALW